MVLSWLGWLVQGAGVVECRSAGPFLILVVGLSTWNCRGKRRIKTCFEESRVSVPVLANLHYNDKRFVDKGKWHLSVFVTSISVWCVDEETLRRTAGIPHELWGRERDVIFLSYFDNMHASWEFIERNPLAFLDMYRDRIVARTSPSRGNVCKYTCAWHASYLSYSTPHEQGSNNTDAPSTTASGTFTEQLHSSISSPDQAFGR